MTAAYEYSVADDFPGGRVNLAKLDAEVRASAIVTALDGITRVEDALTITFKAALSTGDKTILDGDTTDPAGGLIAAHDNTPSESIRITSIVNDDGEIANWPMTESRTPISVPNIVPPGYYAYITGAFDNVAGGSLGNGEQMALEKTDEGDATITGQFLDHFYVLNGSYHDDDGAKIRDWVTMHLYAEASTPAVAPGGDGNADLYAPYFVPNHAGTGGYNVDGAALTAGEINTGLVPLPAYNAAGQPIGHWNWDPTQSPSITPIAVGDMGAPNGHYALLSVPAGIIGRQANRLPLKGGCQNCVPEVVKGKKILPHWKIVFTLHRSAAGSTGVAFEMKVARKRTV